MRVSIKKGVSLRGLRPEMAVALQVAASIYDERRCKTTVTSGTEGYPGDGVHGRDSLHYAFQQDGTPIEGGGCALDLRTKSLPGGYLGVTAHSIRDDIAMALGYDFDVVLEATHIHIEFDPH